MQLKRVYIDGYKNLIDTSIDFQNVDIPIAIIGNNGTGKSNLVEALLHVFIGLYFDDPPNFSFQIVYEAHNKKVSVTQDLKNGNESYNIQVDDNELSRSLFKERIRESELMPPFPALIYCYYSGTCQRTKDLVLRYNKSYQAIIRTPTEYLDRQFVFSDVDQAEWCLLGLFAHKNTRLLDRLSINKFDIFNITLKSPESYNPEKDEPSYWGLKGVIRDLIADLDNSSKEVYKPDSVKLRKQKYELRTYVFSNQDIEKVGAILERRNTNLFSMLKLLDAKKLLHEIDFGVVNSVSGAVYKVDDLSEGEKQLLCVLGGLKLSSQKECLVLLDEPDTHLNPNWSWEYDSLLKYTLDEEQKKKSTVLLATHDPVLISGLIKEQVLIARIEEGILKYEQPFRDPRGQGVANVLTSEYFGLPSSLDKNTQDLLEERLDLASKPEKLTDDERDRLKNINSLLKYLGLTISFRDPNYRDFEIERYGVNKENQ